MRHERHGLTAATAVPDETGTAPWYWIAGIVVVCVVIGWLAVPLLP